MSCYASRKHTCDDGLNLFMMIVHEEDTIPKESCWRRWCVVQEFQRLSSARTKNASHKYVNVDFITILQLSRSEKLETTVGWTHLSDGTVATRPVCNTKHLKPGYNWKKLISYALQCASRTRLNTWLLSMDIKTRGRRSGGFHAHHWLGLVSGFTAGQPRKRIVFLLSKRCHADCPVDRHALTLIDGIPPSQHVHLIFHRPIHYLPMLGWWNSGMAKNQAESLLTTPPGIIVIYDWYNTVTLHVLDNFQLHLYHGDCVDVSYDHSLIRDDLPASMAVRWIIGGTMAGLELEPTHYQLGHRTRAKTSEPPGAVGNGLGSRITRSIAPS